MTTSYPFSYTGTLDAGTRSATVTLAEAAQTIVFECSTTQTLAIQGGNGLGTDLTFIINSTNTNSGIGAFPILTVGFSTYPYTNQGSSGIAPFTIESFGEGPPTSGSNSGSVAVGTPPAGTVIPFDVGGAVSAVSCAGVGATVYGNLAISSPAGETTWTGTNFPTGVSGGVLINDIASFTVSNDEGIDIAYSITGTAYVNSGSEAGEVIVLDSVSPVYLDPISLTGANYGALASAMQVSQDGGAWGAVLSFASGIAWSGDGAVGEYGTHTLQARDANTLVESNTITYTLSSPPSYTFLGLFQSDVIPTAESQYVEFQTPMVWEYETSLLPDNKELLANSAIVTALDLSFIGAQPNVNCYFYDASGSTELGAATVYPSGENTVWGEFVWGEAPWGGTSQYYARALVNWSAPLAFVQGFFRASGTSAGGFSVGALYIQMQTMGYVQQLSSGVT
jgi:hypothetical protein